LAILLTGLEYSINAISFVSKHLQSFHCEYPRKMAFDRMDPSCAIGFYCRQREDFELFCKQAADVSGFLGILIVDSYDDCHFIAEEDHLFLKTKD